LIRIVPRLGSRVNIHFNICHVKIDRSPIALIPSTTADPHWVTHRVNAPAEFREGMLEMEAADSDTVLILRWVQ
jgi:hypothetical protein